MGLSADFLLMASTTVQVEPASTAFTPYGAPTFGSASTYTAVVEPTKRLVLNERGEEVISTATLYLLSTSATVNLQDRVTLPDGRQPKILRVDHVNDDQGQHHVEIALG